MTPYAARPELLDDAPALLMAIETETDESTTSELAALRQTAQQRNSGWRLPQPWKLWKQVLIFPVTWRQSGK